MSSALRGEIDRVGNAATQRKQFEDKMAAAHAALRDMAAQDLNPIKEQPLTATIVERELNHIKVEFIFQ